MRRMMITAVLFMAFMLVAGAAFAKNDNLQCFEINPNPADRECTITLVFQTPANVAMNLMIETPGGEVVRNIYSGVANKVMTFQWDRYSNTGDYMPAGTYFVSLNWDSRYTSTKKTVILK